MLKRIAAMASLVILIPVLAGCSKDARTITVDSLEGTSTVSNAFENSEAYKGQHLESGDTVTVGSEANMMLLLDKDKHVYAESGAVFAVLASGDKKLTKTIVEQSSGSLVFGIDNKLKDGESFEVYTPNATMAVRGTVFTVEIKNGSTSVSVSEGTVVSETIEDGELKSVTLEAGQSDTFEGTSPDFDGAGSNTASESSGNSDPGDSSASDSQEAPSVTLGNQTIDSSFMGVYYDEDKGTRIIVAPGVVPYQLSSEGLLVRHSVNTNFWTIITTDYSGDFFAANLEAPSSNVATDYTENMDGTHMMESSCTFEGDTLTYHRYLPPDDYEETIILTKSDEDPVEAYNNAASAYPIVTYD